MSEAVFSAERFARLMKDRGFTDGKLAYASGVSRTMIYYMRKGEREKVSAEILAAVAKPLKTSTQYLMNQTEDASPVQKTMSAMTADIAEVIEKLSLSKQRELQAIGKALLEVEERTDVEMLYDELMERITRLAELEGGENVLNRLLDHLAAASGRAPGASVSRQRRSGRKPPAGETVEEPTQGDK